MNVKFNIKGIIYGALLILFVMGGFLVLPRMFGQDSTPVDYTMVQREAIPDKILDMMDKYIDQERALAAIIDKKVYVIVTRGDENEKGIQIDKIEMIEKDGKTTMSVFTTYEDKDKSYPFVVAETNLESLPDRIELNSTVK